MLFFTNGGIDKHIPVTGLQQRCTAESGMHTQSVSRDKDIGT